MSHVFNEQKKCSRFSLYLSPCGEKILQEIISDSANRDELNRALEKPETYSAQGGVLRIWYSDYRESAMVPVLQEFLNKASADDYKSITSYPGEYTTEIGDFCGPLRLRTISDFDYDLSHADGASWRCRNCSELGNSDSERCFVREWEAIEVLGKNGHTMSTNFSQHVDGEFYCAKCGCYDVIDDNTGRRVNDPK